MASRLAKLRGILSGVHEVAKSYLFDNAGSGWATVKTTAAADPDFTAMGINDPTMISCVEVLDPANPIETIARDLSRESTQVAVEALLAAMVTDVLSTVNSRNTTLLSNGIFNAITGGSIPVPEDLWGIPAIKLDIFADQDCAANGIIVSWYNDSAGTQIVRQQFFHLDNPTSGIFNFSAILPCLARYGKVTFINGAVAQTAFSLQTLKLQRPMQSNTEANPQHVTLATSDFTTGQQAVDATAVVALVPARSNRTRLSVTNTHATNKLYVQADTVFDLTHGDCIPPLQTKAYYGKAPYYIIASGALTATFADEFGL